jgi:hypothetical protein
MKKAKRPRKLNEYERLALEWHNAQCRAEDEKALVRSLMLEVPGRWPKPTTVISPLWWALGGRTGDL